MSTEQNYVPKGTDATALRTVCPPDSTTPVIRNPKTGTLYGLNGLVDEYFFRNGLSFPIENLTDNFHAWLIQEWENKDKCLNYNSHIYETIELIRFLTGLYEHYVKQCIQGKEEALNEARKGGANATH